MWALIKRLWYASPFHRHRWWWQVIDGVGFNLRFGKVINYHDEFEICVVCKKRREPKPVPPDPAVTLPTARIVKERD